MKRFLRKLLLLPVAVLLIILAVANRHSVDVSLNPFQSGDQALTFQVPMFWLIFAAASIGIIIGGLASWSNQGRYRREARVQRKQAQKLQQESDELRTVVVAQNKSPSLPQA
ncbi:lipopolysaccharide assembly protein LapA domain-containing protein [Polycladidibacter stylochi]|uniref:lipopolysaccharide assembly protein LapA domain-containing protein n=1 Tax=Polycladidibacter stylochi TaxID=1807766 RepID=UPI00082F1F0E|nr:LapA family protein [Pseudovibrio stylochi]